MDRRWLKYVATSIGTALVFSSIAAVGFVSGDDEPPQAPAGDKKAQTKKEPAKADADAEERENAPSTSCSMSTTSSPIPPRRFRTNRLRTKAR